MQLYPIPMRNVTPHALVVEDDPGSLVSIAELVEREGFTTSTAGSVKEARRQIIHKPPDVVLTNLVLPDGSGMDLLDGLAAGASPEVILLTGDAGVDNAMQAMRYGASDYLTKPVDRSRLKSVLAQFARPGDLTEEIGAMREESRRFRPIWRVDRQFAPDAGGLRPDCPRGAY